MAGVCDIPVVSKVCDGAGEVAGNMVAAPFEFFAHSLATVAQTMVEAMWIAFDTTTMLDPSVQGESPSDPARDTAKKNRTDCAKQHPLASFVPYFAPMWEAIAGIGAVGVLVGVVYNIVAAFKDSGEGQTQGNALNRNQPEHTSYEAFVETALNQMLSEAERVSAQYLSHSDGILHTYSQVDVDWKKIWLAASLRTRGIPTFGIRPYWIPTGPGGRTAPFSMLAFMGQAARLRIAMDPNTDQLTLAMLAGDDLLTGQADYRKGDPDGAVFLTAARRLY